MPESSRPHANKSSGTYKHFTQLLEVSEVPHGKSKCLASPDTSKEQASARLGGLLSNSNRNDKQ